MDGRPGVLQAFSRKGDLLWEKTRDKWADPVRAECLEDGRTTLYFEDSTSAYMQLAPFDDRSWEQRKLDDADRIGERLQRQASGAPTVLRDEDAGVVSVGGVKIPIRRDYAPLPARPDRRCRRRPRGSVGDGSKGRRGPFDFVERRDARASPHRSCG
jgi:hypothetical protein